MSLDDIDVTIIRMLQKDARTKYTEIAKECQVSVDTIIKRYDKLKAEGLVRQSTILLDPKKMSYEVIANLSIEVQPGSIVDIINFLGKRSEVLFCTFCMGEYNIFAIAVSRNMEEMNELKEKIQSQEGVVEAQTSIWVGQYLIRPQNFEIEALKEI